MQLGGKIPHERESCSFPCSLYSHWRRRKISWFWSSEASLMFARAVGSLQLRRIRAHSWRQNYSFSPKANPLPIKKFCFSWRGHRGRNVDHLRGAAEWERGSAADHWQVSGTPAPSAGGSQQLQNLQGLDTWTIKQQLKHRLPRADNQTNHWHFFRVEAWIFLFLSAPIGAGIYKIRRIPLKKNYSFKTNITHVRVWYFSNNLIGYGSGILHKPIDKRI